MFKLTIEDDEGKTTVIPLIRDEMTIGRQEGNTIRLTERNVSRKHARLVRQNGTLFIEDLASFTGVRVNGAKIAALTAVREGDEVQIGDYKLMVRTERPPVGTNGDRSTTPSMPAAMPVSMISSTPGSMGGPMATVGGSVAIPTRATPAMSQPPPIPGAARPNSSPSMPAIPAVTIAAAAAAAAAAAPAVTNAGVPDVLEAQPTIPVRTLGEAPAPAPVPEAAPPARLVTLTTELAGVEFALSRASLVIGRTDENEIVLNHRSISRHHAKVVREGDRYTIVDLQSANGVRVNGEDYERIELHPGDIVELGHVKLRFVGPFEHYVFDPKARYGRGRFPTTIAVGALGSVMAVVAVVAFFKARPHDTDAAAPAPEPAVAAAPSPAPVRAPAPLPTAAVPAPAAAQAETGGSPQGLLAEATRAASSEDWEAARAALDRLGTQVANPAMRKQALTLAKRVDTERQGALAFARFDEAQNAKNYGVAVSRYDDIPAESVYKKRAGARFEEARALLVSSHFTAAEKARAAGRCAEVKQEADEIARLDPRNQLAREMVRMCKPQHAESVAAALRPARPRSPSALAAQPSRPDRQERAEHAEAAPAKRAEAPPAEPEVDVDALMKQAREAWVRQQCGSALDLSKRALRARPGMTDAYQIIAACSCSLKDSDGAARAYSKLDEKSRSLVRTLCQRNGVALGGE